MKFDIKKWLIVVLLLALLYCFFKILNLQNDVNSSKKLYELEIKKIKEQKEQTIKNNLQTIDTLSTEIIALKETHIVLTERISDLESRKERIRVIYRDRYREIENLSQNEVETFWRQKFENK